LISFTHWNPGETHAHAYWVSEWYVVCIVLECWELHVLCTIPLIKLSLVAKSLLVIINTALESSIARVTSANEWHSFK
jgi:hypothetical protein